MKGDMKEDGFYKKKCFLITAVEILNFLFSIIWECITAGLKAQYMIISGN